MFIKEHSTFVQNIHTGAVFIAHDKDAEAKKKSADFVEITRERYEEIMTERENKYTLAESGEFAVPITIAIKPKTIHDFKNRIASEGMDPKEYKKAIAMLVEEYALGARMVMDKKSDKRAVKNAYMEDHKS